MEAVEDYRLSLVNSRQQLRRIGFVNGSLNCRLPVWVFSDWKR
jgi:hypothetical protein